MAEKKQQFLALATASNGTAPSTTTKRFCRSRRRAFSSKKPSATEVCSASPSEKNTHERPTDGDGSVSPLRRMILVVDLGNRKGGPGPFLTAEKWKVFWWVEDVNSHDQLKGAEPFRCLRGDFLEVLPSDEKKSRGF